MLSLLLVVSFLIEEKNSRIREENKEKNLLFFWLGWKIL